MWMALVSAMVAHCPCTATDQKGSQSQTAAPLLKSQQVAALLCCCSLFCFCFSWGLVAVELDAVSVCNRFNGDITELDDTSRVCVT